MKMLIKLVWIGVLLCGCGEATHLAYVHETSLGIDVAASIEGTGRFMFGYDRDNYSIIPRKAEGQDAMTLTSLSCTYAKGLDEVQFKHLVSTGKAAKNIAKSPGTLNQINQAIQGGDGKCNSK